MIASSDPEWTYSFLATIQLYAFEIKIQTFLYKKNLIFEMIAAPTLKKIAVL
jgi:hypothetical protein